MKVEFMSQAEFYAANPNGRITQVDCPECDGTGDGDCECCYGYVECTHCDGDGKICLDPYQGYLESVVSAYNRQLSASGRLAMWANASRLPDGVYDGELRDDMAFLADGLWYLWVIPKPWFYTPVKCQITAKGETAIIISKPPEPLSTIGSAVNAADRVENIPLADLPNGVYTGQWVGYQAIFSLNGKNYRLHTAGESPKLAECIITVVNGVVTVKAAE